MNPAFDAPAFEAFLRSWPASPWLVIGLVLSAVVYSRGWIRLRRHDPHRWSLSRLAAFHGALAAIFLALASPIETFADLLLYVHMLQHLLLMIVAPPLLWLAYPLLPVLRGLPRGLRVHFIVPVLRSPLAQDTFGAFTHPLLAWPLFVGVTWIWHAPPGYDLALGDPNWHVAEHLSFFVASLLFWFPVIVPYPSRPRVSRWIILPYLILADVQNTVLAAWLTFSAEPIYRHYTEVPRVGGLTTLADQQLAGVLMWVPGSIAFLLPVSMIAIRLLFGRTAESPRHEPSFPRLPIVQPQAIAAGCNPAQSSARPGWDLLRAPVLGAMLRHRWGRPALQSVLLVLALVVIVDGLTGPAVGPANLAGVAPWIHWRGLVMFGLLVGGNFFCMACPFTLPRRLASRWVPAGRSFPRVLRSKWLAVVLVALFLWSYEAFSLWDSPWLTAWIAIAYFAAALLVDGLFRDAAFCKYVCPIGQFNFVQSLISPLEVRVREPATCTSCQTKDCIRGSEQLPGCGTHLFQPRKLGNLDCTFCLDCVQACPHQNVGILATFPGRTLTQLDTFRSGLGRLGRRADLAVLVLLLVFGAFANAGGMIAPVVAWQDDLRERLGGLSTRTVITGYYILALLLGPAVLLAVAAWLSRWWGGVSRPAGQLVIRFAYALIPLGFGMWLAHHGFHFFTSYATILPVSQRMAADLGWGALGEPAWQHACCLVVADWIVKFELLALDLGLLASLFVGYRIAVGDPTIRSSLAAFLPWAALMLLLFAAGVWIVLEPMQMRGTLPAG